MGVVDGSDALRLPGRCASLTRLYPRPMERVVRLGVAASVLVAVALGLVYFVRAVDELGEQASANAAANYDDREFGGGNSLVVDKRALYEARALIPPDGSYHLVPGPNVEAATELTEPYIDQFARYFLMPRRPSPGAEWIICYGCDPALLEQPADVVWDGGDGISIHRTSS
jgi:hypothetical protein